MSKSFNITVSFTAKLVVADEFAEKMRQSLEAAQKIVGEAEDGKLKRTAESRLSAYEGLSDDALVAALVSNTLRHDFRESVLKDMGDLSDDYARIGKVSPFTVEVTPRGN